MDDKKVQLEVSDEAREWIARKGYDKTMGARPMQRVIQENIKKPLADEILFGELQTKGGIVLVDLKNDIISLSFKPIKKTNKVT